jgi:hypothetical protein
VPGWPVVPLPRVTVRMKHGLGVKLEPATMPATVPTAG